MSKFQRPGLLSKLRPEVALSQAGGFRKGIRVEEERSLDGGIRRINRVPRSGGDFQPGRRNFQCCCRYLSPRYQKRRHQRRRTEFRFGRRRFPNTASRQGRSASIQRHGRREDRRPNWRSVPVADRSWSWHSWTSDRTSSRSSNRNDRKHRRGSGSMYRRDSGSGGLASGELKPAAHCSWNWQKE